ncbi:SPOR domain-containing protein [Virgibacillus ndiopensis]|uniref:SPOR domain-containing protein n=1 Tax=Virgibacillus ndiopensis TaxID=2004408 RepID=UPI000C083A27|nr:SPOR domain-containing protein [Virgibacillus ndiopensis]
MKKKKPIILWINGKKTKINRNADKRDVYMYDREQAATIEDSSNKDNTIPTLARQHDYEINGYVGESMDKSRFSIYKPIIFATVSALVIGLCLGIIMLNMFVGIGKEVSGTGNVPNQLLNNNENNSSASGNTTESAVSNVTFEQINGYVLQAGVFSNETNANEWAKKYDKSGFGTMLWKRDGKYYLLAGLSSTKEHAKEQAKSLKEKDFEIYVKEWSTSEIQKSLTKEEGEWIHSFRDLWYESLMAVTGQEVISTDSWKSLLDRYPKQSDRLSSFFDVLKNSYKQFSEVNQQRAQIILLNQWKQYETSLSK